MNHPDRLQAGRQENEALSFYFSFMFYEDNFSEDMAKRLLELAKEEEVGVRVTRGNNYSEKTRLPRKIYIALGVAKNHQAKVVKIYNALMHEGLSWGGIKTKTRAARIFSQGVEIPYDSSKEEIIDLIKSLPIVGNN